MENVRRASRRSVVWRPRERPPRAVARLVPVARLISIARVVKVPVVTPGIIARSIGTPCGSRRHARFLALRLRSRRGIGLDCCCIVERLSRERLLHCGSSLCGISEATIVHRFVSNGRGINGQQLMKGHGRSNIRPRLVHPDLLAVVLLLFALGVISVAIAGIVVLRIIADARAVTLLAIGLSLVIGTAGRRTSVLQASRLAF